MTEEFQQDQEHSEDTMFQDAVAALRKGDKPRAKELLTLLLKADQNNPTYWIWLSASMDNAKERVYCLQTAFKLDPENVTAKRGLILLGALAPDESIQPFAVNRPRAWEEKLLLANERPREKGLKAIMKHPAMRLAGIGAIAVGLIAVVFVGFILPRRSTFVAENTNTPGPSPTFTATPTLFGAVSEPTKFALGPTPLWMLLKETYTPTAVYVGTQRAGASRDQYRGAEVAYQKNDWDAYIASMKLVAALEPESADIPYLIGEAYRFKGDSGDAINAYKDALNINDEFGPAYLGLARARLLADPAAEVEFLFDEAIKRDPNFGDIYLDLARYHLSHKNAKSALADLDRAAKLMPNSADVYMLYAETYLALDDKKKALAAAEKAYAADITALPVYKMLGEMYIESGQYKRAIEALDVFVVYQTDDAEALALLGRAYYETKDYKTAAEQFDKAFVINRNSLRKYYEYRGIANLELGNVEQAVEDLETALASNEKSYEINFGLARGYFMQEKFGTAFQKIEAVKALAKTDEQTALMLYWRALIQEKRGQMKDAVKDWQALMAMDEKALTPEMRADALAHLKAAATPTMTPKPVKKTATPTPTRTPKRTPTPIPTRTPKRTPAPNVTPTPKVNVTITPPPPQATITPPPKITVTVTATATPR